MNSEMNKKKPTKVSIVIPVYNGEQSIGRLTDELVSALKELYNLEIVLVNDNSPDNSEAVCEGLFKKYPDIVCFYSLAKNVGEHNAVMAGLNQATGDYMVIMDDDFQNPITEVVKLVNFATENDCDVTYTFYKKKKHSFFRNLGSRFNDRVANVMLKKPKNLYLSSFKVLNRFIVDEITKYDLPYPYIDGLILRTTDKIAKLEVEHHEREAGRSGYTLTKLVRLWLNMFTSFSILPLRVSTILGMIFSLLGLGLGVFTVVEKLANPDLPIGYASTIVVISIFAGIQLLSLGVIGEYVGRIFMSFNKKPQYTIRKRFTPVKKERK
jgi:undecaprenyl-phosphate 4-deoxy-4-formamido-L-arabinose transferase